MFQCPFERFVYYSFSEVSPGSKSSAICASLPITVDITDIDVNAPHVPQKTGVRYSRPLADSKSAMKKVRSPISLKKVSNKASVRPSWEDGGERKIGKTMFKALVFN